MQSSTRQQPSNPYNRPFDLIQQQDISISNFKFYTNVLNQYLVHKLPPQLCPVIPTFEESCTVIQYIEKNQTAIPELLKIAANTNDDQIFQTTMMMLIFIVSAYNTECQRLDDPEDNESSHLFPLTGESLEFLYSLVKYSDMKSHKHFEFILSLVTELLRERNPHLIQYLNPAHIWQLVTMRFNRLSTKLYQQDFFLQFLSALFINSQSFTNAHKIQIVQMFVSLPTVNQQQKQYYILTSLADSGFDKAMNKMVMESSLYALIQSTFKSENIDDVDCVFSFIERVNKTPEGSKLIESKQLFKVFSHTLQNKNRDISCLQFNVLDIIFLYVKNGCAIRVEDEYVQMLFENYKQLKDLDIEVQDLLMRLAIALMEKEGTEKWLDVLKGYGYFSALKAALGSNYEIMVLSAIRGMEIVIGGSDAYGKKFRGLGMFEGMRKVKEIGGGKFKEKIEVVQEMHKQKEEGKKGKKK